MKQEKKEKLNKNMQRVISEFIERGSNRTSLITVTRCEISDDREKLHVYLSVFPEDQEKSALSFIERKKWEARDYIKKKLRTRVIPFLFFEIDKGEKNRQKINRLLNEIE